MQQTVIPVLLKPCNKNVFAVLKKIQKIAVSHLHNTSFVRCKSTMVQTNGYSQQHDSSQSLLSPSGAAILVPSPPTQPRKKR